ncbi:hypothetical protein CHH61_19110 [Shouchella clausii]|uniref:DUF3310 domain-containing protein n=1 Tax=Shouchella clausii TaxID=79880 RepID=A0A268RVW3_SHOCL|nr:DUF3310 domain-containing protein [Shouchella clausii]PAF24405.1 hypothetical protein CHH61_19110 [Shouchella clausii]
MNKPKHYDPHIDPIAYMKVNMSRGNYEGFLIGNVLKYITRYPKKNGLEDLKKAKDYIEKAIELYEEEEEGKGKQDNHHNWVCPRCKKSNSHKIPRGSIFTIFNCSYCSTPVMAKFK